MLATLCSGVAVALLLATCSAPPSHWNQAHGNSRNSGFLAAHTSDHFLPKWVTPLWIAAPSFLHVSDPVIAADGAVVVSGSASKFDIAQGQLACIEPSNGMLRFDVPTALGIVSTPAATVDGRIVVTERPSDRYAPVGTAHRGPPVLACYDLAGTRLWERPLYSANPNGRVGDHVTVSPPKAFRGNSNPPYDALDTIFVVAADNSELWLWVYGSDGTWLDSGRLEGPLPDHSATAYARWLPAPAVVPPASPERPSRVYITLEGADAQEFEWDSWSHRLVGFRSQSIPLGSDRVTPPIAGTNRSVIIATRGVAATGALTAFDGNFNLAWHCLLPTLQVPRAPALFVDGTNSNIYVSDSDGVLLINSCSIDATYTLRDPGAPAVSLDRVYVSAADGLHTFDFALAPTALAPPSRTPKLFSTQPAIGSDGTVYESATVGGDVTNPASTSVRAFGGTRVPIPPQ